MRQLAFIVFVVLIAAGLGSANAQTYVFKNTPDGDLRATFTGGRVLFDEMGPQGLEPKSWHTSFGAVNANVRTIHSHEGGWITKHMAMIERAKETGEYVRLECDQLNLISLMVGCVSAATMWLGMPRDQMCIGKNARFGFHGATGYGSKDASERVTLRRDWSAYMAGYYPPKLRRAFLDGGWDGYAGFRMKFITAAEVKKMDPSIQYCK